MVYRVLNPRNNKIKKSECVTSTILNSSLNIQGLFGQTATTQSTGLFGSTPAASGTTGFGTGFGNTAFNQNQVYNTNIDKFYRVG